MSTIDVIDTTLSSTFGNVSDRCEPPAAKKQTINNDDNLNENSGESSETSAVEEIEGETILNGDSIHDKLTDLSGFTVTQVLLNNTNRKVTCLKGTFESHAGDAIIVLEKPAFSDETIHDYFAGKDGLTKSFQNDIYGDYRLFPTPELTAVKATVIHPATDKHIQRYTSQRVYMIEETPELYKNVILPELINEEEHLQWVYNILEHKSETEKIVVEDSDPETGFILLPDLKWSGEPDTLYLLAVVNKRNIKSLRDLTADHLPLLKNIKKKGIEAIKDKYSVDQHELRIYFHYQPTFYHLHVHFCVLKHEAPGILAGKAHLLSDVINNLEIAPDYYKKATLSFVIAENDKYKLYEKLKAAIAENKE